MSEYLQSTSGRLFAGAMGLVLGASAVSAFLGAAPEALWVWAFMVFFGVVAGAAGAMLGLGDYPVETALAVLVLPVLGLPYIIGMPVVMAAFPPAAYLLAVLALGLFAVALRPAHSESAGFSSTRPAHAAGH